MKKFIVLLICLVLSTVFFTGCTSNGEPFTEKSYTSEGKEIKEIFIDVQDRQIEVMLSPDNQVYIDYFENSKEYYDISVSDNNKLTMTSASNKEWTDYIGLKPAGSSRKILVKVPDTILTALKISTTNEDISLPSMTIIGDISISSQGGNIAFERLNAEKSINISAKNGDITGSIIGSYDDYAISSESKKGKNNLPSDKNSGTKTLTVSCNNGDIDIQFIGK